MKILNRTETGYVESEWQQNCFKIVKKPFSAVELVESTPMRNLHAQKPKIEVSHDAY